ncbi:MAG: putative quinol monooxygenase [Acetobacteraceae bacterium]
MLALWVKVRVKPEERERFVKAIEVDAIGSERDEPGCLRFNVLPDQQDQNVYYFFEVYRDEAALETHQAAPHYAVWRAATDTLDGRPRRRVRYGISRGARWVRILRPSSMRSFGSMA